MRIPKIKCEVLDKIPNDGELNDRKYVKELFETIFTNTYLTNMCENGHQKQQMLKVIESTKEYMTMKGESYIRVLGCDEIIYSQKLIETFYTEMFKCRVYSGNTVDIEKRVNIFDKTIHKKINNWFMNHGKKIVAPA